MVPKLKQLAHGKRVGCRMCWKLEIGVVAVAFASVVLAGCDDGGEADPDPCNAAVHCHRTPDGQAECDDGYDWENSSDSSSYVCLPLEVLPTCGDGTCDADEDETSCPDDCPGSTECGDGTCDADEDETSCPDDCLVESEPVSVTILHTNDTHSQLEPFEPFGEPIQGGVARRLTLINEVRGDVGEESVITVDAGDFFQGTIFFNAWGGSAEIMALNAMEYDAVTLGNHEFDFGPDALLRALVGDPVDIAGTTHTTEALEVPIVSTNIDLGDEPELAELVESSIVISKAGQRFGIVGAITTMMATSFNPWDTVSAYDYVTSVQAEVDALEASGVNKIILLSHCGCGVDQGNAPLLSGVDVIVSGHDHQLLLPAEAYAEGAEMAFLAERVDGDYPLEVSDSDGHTTLIVSAYNSGRILGRLDVDFDADGLITDWAADPMFVSVEVPEDVLLSDELALYAAQVELFGGIVIGQVGMYFDGARFPGVRTQEMAIGNLITDAMLAAVEHVGAVAAITNGGGIRASLPDGVNPGVEAPPYDVTFGDAVTVLPFGNMITVLDVTGQELVAALDAGLTWSHFLGLSFTPTGSFPQVSGMNVSFCGSTVSDIQSEIVPPADCVAPLNAGGVVTALEIDGAAVDLTATYRIATNDYLAGGGDFYTSFADACSRSDGYCIDTGVLLLDALAVLLESDDPVTRSVEGRLNAE